MSGIQICDEGAVNLIGGIIKKAIDDYVEAKMDLDLLAETDTAVMKVIYLNNIKKDRKYWCRSLEEGFEILQREVDKRYAMIEDVKRFFESEYYKGLTDISSDYMLQEAERIYQEKKAELERRRVEAEEAEREAKKSKARYKKYQFKKESED